MFTHTRVLAAAVGTILALGAVLAVGADGAKVVRSSGDLVAFADPYGNGAANPVSGGEASVHSVTTPGDKTIVTLHVSGLAANREFGAHVHLLACDDNKAGGHYRDDPSAGATPENEVWLDFTTNASGRGEAQAVVDFAVRPGEANSVVIHDHHTDAAGAAGAKLGCLNVDF